MRDRILEATFTCVARYGVGKTTVEDVAREARLSRATVYRYFSGGKDELIRDTISWEVARFFTRLATAVDGVTDFGELLVEALVFAHRAVEEHEVLQKVLETEPERLLPQLNVDSERIRGFIRAFLAPHIPDEALPPGTTTMEAADYVSRMLLSFIGAQGGWDLTDREQVRELVRTELIGGLSL